MAQGRPTSFSFFCAVFAFAFVFLHLSVPGARAQGTCEMFAFQPDFCVPVVAGFPPNPNTTTFVQPGSSQASVAANLTATFYRAVAFPRACQEALAELSCLGQMAQCAEVIIGPGMSFFLPRPACRSVCDRVVQNCANSFAAIGQQPPNCSQTTNIAGSELPVFPEVEWIVFGNTIPCETPVVPLSLPDPPCPPYYAPNPYEDAALACAPECPIPYYTADQWDALWYLYALFGILTLVVAIFVLPPYFFSPDKWRWPQQMNMWIMFCSTMLGLGNSAPLIFYGNNWRDVVCANDVAAADMTDSSLCAFQAVFQIYFGISGILWWLFLVAKAALLVNGYRTHTWAEMICAHVYCWGVPFIPLIILLSNTKVGSGSPPICNYLVSGAGDDGWWIQSTLLIPEAIILLVGCGFMTALLYTLIKYEGLKGFRKKGRLLTYLICFLIPNIYLEVFYYVTKTHNSKELEIQRWLECLATTYSEEACEHLKDVPNYPAQVVNVLLVSSVIFSYMLIFGLKRSVFQWWWALIKGIFTCDFSNFNHWWSDISTSQQTSHSTSVA